MGNAASRHPVHIASSDSKHQKPQHRHIKSKRSTSALTALGFGCTSASVYYPKLPEPTSQDSTLNDKDEKLTLHSPLCALSTTDDGAAAAYKIFLKTHPGYQSTWIIDTLRKTDLARLDRAGETYVDYMGGSLYPDSLVRLHTDFLHHNILGNTHSVSNASKLSSRCADEARQAVLSFFSAPAGYTVVFTANASAALKLVGESFPFGQGSNYVLCADSHNSVHGIRQFAAQRGAQIHYIESTSTGGVDPTDAKDIITTHRPQGDVSPSLFALTGQSNISNAKNPLSLIQYASSLGYSTLLDAAALAPTSVVSLTDTPVDAMAISFYKMFGFPTGVGALVVKESFLAKLNRPWFAGGTVDIVQVPGTVVTMASKPYEQFEDGTINYLNLPAVTQGLRFLSAYLPFLPLRLSSLTRYLIASLSEVKHERTGTPVARVLSRVPVRKLKAIGEQSDAGSTVSLIFLEPEGGQLPLSFVEHAASTQNISLRTGCMCNPGGAAALLGHQLDMGRLCPGVTMKDFEGVVGHEVGVVRVSLGLASNFQDAYRVVKFAQALGEESRRQAMWKTWSEENVGRAL